MLTNTENLLAIAETLTTALWQAEDKLQDFALAPDLTAKMQQVFGDEFQQDIANQLLTAWQQEDFSQLPEIKILSVSEMNGANAGYAIASNTIYISQDFLFLNQQNLKIITNVLIEEIGHFLDAQINSEDTPGDEGKIFASVVLNQNLTDTESLLLQQKNDQQTILNGTVEIEASSVINIDWLQQQGSSNDEQSSAVFVDQDKNVYITGFTLGDLQGNNQGSKDAWVTKYDADGTKTWTVQLGTAKDDESRSVVADSNGNVYISGTTSGILGDRNFGGRDAWIAKYDVDGKQIWLQQLGTFQDDEAQNIALDSNDNLYITGFTSGSLQGINAGNRDAWIAKYDTNGNQTWIQQLGTEVDDISYDIALDDLNNIYIAGYTEGAIAGIEAGKYDGWVAKYDKNGNKLWTEQLGTGIDADGYTRGVAVDGNGNVYLTGIITEAENPNSFDALIAKYSPNGDKIWTKQINSNGWDSAYDIGVDSNNNIYISGFTLGNLGGTNQGNADAWVAKYDSQGTQIWIEQEKISTTEDDYSQGIAIDNDSNIYVSGFTNGNLDGNNNGGKDVFIAKLTQELTIPLVSISDNFTVRPGENLTVPILINNAAGLSSTNISLRYDNAILDVVEIVPGSLTSEWSLTPNVNDNTGIINLSLFQTTPLTGGAGSLVEINFKVAPDAPVDISSNLNFSQVYLNEGKIANTSDNGTINIEPDILQVTELKGTNTGFEVKFNISGLNLDVLNLYGSGDTTENPPDLRLQEANGNEIKGSLLWNQDQKTLTFVKTPDILEDGKDTSNFLEAGTYTVTLFSREDGIATVLGNTLDGNKDSIAGGDYEATFTIANNPNYSLTLPDFTRGPSQKIDVPADDNFLGLPITLNNNQNVNNVQFELVYNPDILRVNDVSLAANLPVNWNLTNKDLTTPGVAKISLSGTDILAAGATNLVYLDAEVLDTVAYGTSTSITLDQVLVNNNISGVGDVAIQQVALFGDVDQDEEYTGLDAALISRVSVGLDSGFNQYPLINPFIIGDVNSNGILGGEDASLVASAALGLPSREIP